MAPSLLQLHPSYETFSKDVDNLGEDVSAEFGRALSSRLSVQSDANGLNLNETLRVAHKQGFLDDGESASRIFSGVAKNTKYFKQIEYFIQKNKSLFPEKRAKFLGREEDVKKITERLRNKVIPGINLFGESGVGKTTLAKEVSKEFKEFKTVTVDLRDIDDMDTVYSLILLEFGIQSWDTSVNKVYEYLNDTLDKKTLVILDNVEQLLNIKSAKEQFVRFLKAVIETSACKNKLLKLILTSQVKVDEPSMKGKFFTEYEVQPLDNKVSKKLITQRRNDVLGVPEEESDQELTEISKICRDLPYLLQVVEQLVRSSSSTTDVLKILKTQIEQKVPKEFSCISTLFDSQLNDHLKEVAVKISLLRRPFSVSTAMKIAEIEAGYAESDLEMLVNYKVIAAKDVGGKRKYDTHGLFKDFIKYLCGSQPGYDENLKQGEKQFFEHFSGKMAKLATKLETEFVTTYSKLEINRANFELVIDLSEENKETLDLLLHTDDHKQFALMGILFEVLKDVDERRNLFAKWADMAEKQENWLASALMRCWQSLQCTDIEGVKLVESTVDKAHECIKKAEGIASEKQMNEIQSLYSHCSGKTKYYRATKLVKDSKERTRLLKEGIENLKDGISSREKFIGDSTLSSRALNLIGNCYMELDQLENALKYYEDAMAMKMKLVKSEDHWEFPTFYNQIAQVHDELGRRYEQGIGVLFGGKEKAKIEYEKAAEWMEKSLKLQEKLEVSGTKHTATFQRNLANILLGLEEYDKALDYAKKSYDIRNKLLGKHPDTVRVLYQIGLIQEWRNYPEEALQKYEEGVEMEESLPEDSHSAARELLYDRLEVMCNRVKKRYDGKQPDNVRILYLIGICQEFKGKSKAALQSYEKALKIEECLPEDNHSAVRKKLYVRLAEMYKKMKQEGKLKEIEIKIQEQEDESEPVELQINVYQNGGYYNHSKYGHFIYVPPNTVTEPTKITCKVFKTPPNLSLVKLTETIASYIVELGPTSVSLQNPIIVTLLHSGPVREHGYEIIVKSFNAENESWEKMEVLKEDSHAPEYSKCHYLQVSLKELSTLAVVTQLIGDRFQVTPEGCVVRSSVNNDVMVDFPEGAVDKTVKGIMKVLPEQRIVVEDCIVGFPALLFYGFQEVKFSKPVKISLPFESSRAPGSHHRLLRLDCDSQSNGQWKSVTFSKVEHGLMKFDVDHFSAFWPLETLNVSAKYVIDSVNACYQEWFNPPNDVSFAAYRRKEQTGRDLDLKLTCVALERQDALTDKMKGKSFATLVESNGDHPMKCREKAHAEVEGLSVWDKGFFLQFLGEEKECNKQFCGTSESDFIKLHYYNDHQNRLCSLRLKTKIEDYVGDSSLFIEYFGISLDVLKDSPEDIAVAKELLPYVKIQISLTRWDTEGVQQFYSSLPRKEDCLKDLIKCLGAFDGAKHISRNLKEGHDLVMSPLKNLEQGIQDKVIDIVASNTIGYQGSKLPNYLDVSKEFVDECRQKYSGAEQVSQILRKWMESSDECTIEKLFQALKYIKNQKAVAELANYITQLSLEKAKDT